MVQLAARAYLRCRSVCRSKRKRRIDDAFTKLFVDPRRGEYSLRGGTVGQSYLVGKRIWSLFVGPRDDSSGTEFFGKDPGHEDA